MFSLFLSWSFCFFERSAIRGNSSCTFLFPNDATCWLSFPPWSFRRVVLGRQAAEHTWRLLFCNASRCQTRGVFLMVIQDADNWKTDLEFERCKLQRDLTMIMNDPGRYLAFMSNWSSNDNKQTIKTMQRRLWVSMHRWEKKAALSSLRKLLD